MDAMHHLNCGHGCQRIGCGGGAVFLLADSGRRNLGGVQTEEVRTGRFRLDHFGTQEYRIVCRSLYNDRLLCTILITHFNYARVN